MTAVFELKSAALPVLALWLKTSDLGLLAQALAARWGGEAESFDHEALCLDLSALRDADEPLEFAALLALLRSHGLHPVAARAGSPAQMAAARAAGLSEAPEGKPIKLPAPVPEPAPAPATTAASGIHVALSDVAREAPKQPAQGQTEAAPVETEPQPAPRAGTLIIDKPLRSGQKVYARGGDLIVMAVVSHGAEVAADGSIHVYGPLRGRALAGLHGDTSARVFAACMEPQLVSIAGMWRTFEDGLPAPVAGKAAQVRLEGEKLLLEPLKF